MPAEKTQGSRARSGSRLWRHERRDKIPPAAKIRVTEALQRIVGLYEAWDNPDKATEWKQRLAEHQAAEAANGESPGIEKK